METCTKKQNGEIIVIRNTQCSHAGKDDGGVSMMKVSESLSSITRESTLNSLFDLERRREKSLELLEREATLKERNKKNLKCIPRLIR